MSFVWMPFYIADYLADTSHLSTLEHGAYLLLIMHYWQTGSLPIEDEQLARITRLPTKEWRKLKPTLAAFFSADWKHGRIEEELKHASHVSTRRREAGQKRKKILEKEEAIAEQLISNSSLCEEQLMSNSLAIDKQLHPQPQPPSHKEESIAPEEGAGGQVVVNFLAYVFEGHTIRVKRDQFDRWVKSYPHIQDLKATLETVDAYYTEHPPPDGKWFFPVARWLEKENARAKTDKRKAGYGTDWF